MRFCVFQRNQVSQNRDTQTSGRRKQLPFKPFQIDAIFPRNTMANNSPAVESEIGELENQLEHTA